SPASRGAGREEGAGRPRTQRAAGCEGGMHPAVGHGYDSKGPLPDKRPAEPRGCPLSGEACLIAAAIPVGKAIVADVTIYATRHHECDNSTNQPAQEFSRPPCGATRGLGFGFGDCACAMATPKQAEAARAQAR